MYCINCGKEIGQGTKYCPSCGTQINDPWEDEQTASEKVDRNIQRTAPRAQPSKNRNSRPLVFVMGFIIIAIMTSVVIRGLGKFGHDLSGTWYTNDFFPVTSLVFQQNGTFTAYNEYDVLQGKYSKRGNKYSLKFKDGKSTSGGPVNDYLASSAGLQYELEAEKISDGQLRIYVIPKTDYWAWYGKYTNFYNIELTNMSEDTLGRPPEEDCIDIDTFIEEPLTLIDRSSGYEYEYEHNTMGNLTEKVEYNDNGDIISRTEYEYDSDNHLKEEKVYGSTGNLLSGNIYDLEGHITESMAYSCGEIYQCYGYEYDAVGNLIKKELKYGSSEGGPSIIKYEYDNMNNMIRCIRGWNDTNGNFIVGSQEEYEYDIAGTLLKKVFFSPGDPYLDIEPSEQWYEYEYEDNGKLVREICFDTSGNISGWIESEYDEAGDLIKTTYYNSDGERIR